METGEEESVEEDNVENRVDEEEIGGTDLLYQSDENLNIEEPLNLQRKGAKKRQMREAD